MIEHKSALAVRTGSDLVKKTKVSVNILSGEPSSLAALFAYFAGNTDYNFTQGRRGDDCCHNAVALTKNDETIPVPYDFDVSGFVDPPYAKPPPNVKVKKVTQRLYRGFCAHKESIAFAKERFLNARSEIDQLLASYPSISTQRRTKLQRYSEKFFAILSDPKQFERKIIRECR